MSRSSSRRATQKPARKPLTREMLLPLPVAKVRSMSLEHHLALAAMRTGNGNVDQMSCLLKAVYLAYFLREATRDHCGMQAFRASEAALECSAIRVQMGHKWMLPEEDQSELAGVLAVHDRQLLSVSAHQFSAARERLQRFLDSEARSPFPVPEVE
jgi:hypothetical protein